MKWHAVAQIFTKVDFVRETAAKKKKVLDNIAKMDPLNICATFPFGFVFAFVSLFVFIHRSLTQWCPSRTRDLPMIAPETLAQTIH